jgi:ferredoxin
MDFLRQVTPPVFFCDCIVGAQAGTDLFGGRGHIIASYGQNVSDGVDRTARPWSADRPVWQNMLVIHPHECIDCGVCEPECPPKAILSDSDPKAQEWLALNPEYARKWPNIASKGNAPEDAADWVNVSEKYSRYFCPEPGEGK